VGAGTSPSALSAVGGGASPLAGAVINRIDARFQGQVNVEINLPNGALQGLTPEMQANVIAGSVETRVDRQLREAFDFYREAVTP
jgi:hypothetical protein